MYSVTTARLRRLEAELETEQVERRSAATGTVVDHGAQQTRQTSSLYRPAQRLIILWAVGLLMVSVVAVVLAGTRVQDVLVLVMAGVVALVLSALVAGGWQRVGALLLFLEGTALGAWAIHAILTQPHPALLNILGVALLVLPPCIAAALLVAGPGTPRSSTSPQR